MMLSSASKSCTKAASAIIVCLAALCGPQFAASAGSGITQRGINDYAAALLQCRLAVLERPGLRKAGETMPQYIERACSPLPGEQPAAYRLRIAGVISALQSAAAATETLRAIPTLRDQSQANLALWRRAVKDVGYLPRRMNYVRRAWKTASVTPAQATPLGEQVLTTLQLVLDAYANLRDCRP